MDVISSGGNGLDWLRRELRSFLAKLTLNSDPH